MQLRCQGYLCPQWAVDISTEQYIHQVGVEVETWMQEALPLAPTVERSQLMLSAYDASTRIFTGCWMGLRSSVPGLFVSL